MPATMRCNPSSSKPPCSPQIMISPVEISSRWRSVLPVRLPPANTNTGGPLGSTTRSSILNHDVRELAHRFRGNEIAARVGVDQRVQSGLDVGLGSGHGMSGKRDALKERV